MTRLIKLVFSPSGGTKKVADILANKLAQEWTDEVLEIDLCNPCLEKISLLATDMVMIAMPSYGGRAPEIAMQRLSLIAGNDALCLLVCVYGNRAFEDTLVEMADGATACQLRVMGAVAAIAEHSIVRNIAHARPDKEDEKWLAAAARKLHEKIIKADICVTIPGNRPYKPRGNGGIIPGVSDTCIQCGMCADNCPNQAIDFTDVRKVNETKCIHCMRCVSVCPTHSRIIDLTSLTRISEMLNKVAATRKENELFI